jgi:hypothetical protein
VYSACYTLTMKPASTDDELKRDENLGPFRVTRGEREAFEQEAKRRLMRPPELLRLMIRRICIDKEVRI